MEETSSQQKLSQIPNSKLTSEYSNNHQNGNHTIQETSLTNEQLSKSYNNRLPSPGLF
jgi:hypothetical protein